MKPPATPPKIAVSIIAAALIGSLSTHAVAAVTSGISGDAFHYFFGGIAQQTADGTGPYNFTDTLAASGYSSGQLNHATSVIDTTSALNSARSPNAFGNNRLTTGIDLGTFNPMALALDGSVEQITNVTLLLYVASIAPAAGSKTFTLFSGLYSTTGALSTFTVSPSDVGQFISINIPIAVAFSGFSIGDGTLSNPAPQVNTGTERNPTVSFQPGYRVDTILVSVPEPAASLLGGIGTLLVLFRRRAIK